MKTVYKAMQSEPYKTKKNLRMAELKKAREKRSIENARDYFAIANGISGKDRIDSRSRIIAKKVEINNGNKW